MTGSFVAALSFCFYAIPGKTASRFAWENRFALCLELL
jgi:hypothetical protein